MFDPFSVVVDANRGVEIVPVLAGVGESRDKLEREFLMKTRNPRAIPSSRSRHERRKGEHGFGHLHVLRKPLDLDEEPRTHNGTESAIISKKNSKGNLLRDAVIFEESSIADCGNGGMCGSCFKPLMVLMTSSPLPDRPRVRRADRSSRRDVPGATAHRRSEKCGPCERALCLL
jgi:hypothetical protein